MTVETADYVAQLDPAEPRPASKKQEGDDQIRLIKKVLKQALLGFPGTILVAGTDTGVSNTYVLSLTTPLVAYTQFMAAVWLPTNTNGGASTINISGLGAVPIRRIDGTVVENGDIMAGTPVAMVYNGTEFRLSSITKRYIDNLVTSGVLPGQTGNAGKPLITDGTNASFSSTYGVAMDEAEGAPIVSAATLNLTSGAGTGNFTHITGTNSISAMTLPAGACRDLVFDSTPILVNGANLILPTGANIMAQAGDTLRVRGEGSGVARVVDYTRKSGRALVEPTTPGITLLAVVTPTAVAAVDFLNVFSGTYDDYLIVGEGLTRPGALGGSTLRMRLAQGGVLDTTANYLYGESGPSSLSTSLDVAPGSVDSTTAMRIDLLGMNAANGNDVHAVLANGVYYATAPAVTSNEHSGVHRNTSPGAITGFRLYWLDGVNFGATGTIRVYGYKKV